MDGSADLMGKVATSVPARGSCLKAGEALQSTMAGSGMLFIPASPVMETLLPL